MTDYWRSTAKHWCAPCGVWISGHARNVATHNASAGHRARVEQSVKQMVVAHRAADAADAAVADQIRLIEAAARGAAAPLPPEGVHGFRYTQPSLAPAEKIRQREQLADFISAKLQERNLEASDYALQQAAAAAGTAAAALPSYRYLDPVFFGTVDELPDSIRSLARDPAAWKQESHETTGLPIWFHPAFNVYVWSEPVAVEGLQVAGVAAAAQAPATGAAGEPPAESASSPDEQEELTLEALVNRAKMRAGMTGAGIPGEWVVTHESGLVNQRSADAEEEKRLEDVLEATNTTRKTVNEYRSALDAADATRRERETRPVAVGKETTGFRKRKLV